MSNLKAVDTTTVSAAVADAVKYIAGAVKKGEEIRLGGYRAAAEVLAPGLAMHYKTWYRHGIDPKITDKGLLEVFKIYRQISKLLKDGGMPQSSAGSAIGLIRQYAMEVAEPVLAAEIASKKKAATEASRAARAEKRSFRERIEADVVPVIRMGESTADSDLDLADMGLLKALKSALKAAGIKWQKPETL
jgi:hypothetical protein